MAISFIRFSIVAVAFGMLAVTSFAQAPGAAPVRPPPTAVPVRPPTPSPKKPPTPPTRLPALRLPVPGSCCHPQSIHPDPLLYPESLPCSRLRPTLCSRFADAPDPLHRICHHPIPTSSSSFPSQPTEAARSCSLQPSTVISTTICHHRPIVDDAPPSPPSSIEFAHFYAKLLFEAATDDRGYEEVIQECEHALRIPDPIDPTRDSLQDEAAYKLSSPEARIYRCHTDLHRPQPPATGNARTPPSQHLRAIAVPPCRRHTAMPSPCLRAAVPTPSAGEAPLPLFSWFGPWKKRRFGPWKKGSLART